MNVIWNKCRLEHPPSITSLVDAHTHDTTNFVATLENAVTELESQDLLRTEAAVLSRLIYRMKCKFRNDKGLKNMEKVNRALLNYLTLALEKEYKFLRTYVQSEGKLITVPSKQMLQYVLVRTQSFAKLLLRIEKVARCSADYFKLRIASGHAWTISVISYSVVSRIWFFARQLIEKACIWYIRLHQYLEMLPLIGPPWLPRDYKLPPNLKSWLGVSWISEEKEASTYNEKEWQDTMFRLIASQEEGFTSMNDTTKLNELQVFTGSSVEQQVPYNSNTDVPDIGEHIDRNYFRKSLQGKPPDRRETIEIRTSFTKKRKYEKNTNEADERTKFRETVSIAETNETKASEKEVAFRKLLNKDSHPGFDRLQWNIIKNNGRKLLKKIDKCTEDGKKAVLLARMSELLKADDRLNAKGAGRL